MPDHKRRPRDLRERSRAHESPDSYKQPELCRLAWTFCKAQANRMSNEKQAAERADRIDVKHEYELCAWARRFKHGSSVRQRVRRRWATAPTGCASTCRAGSARMQSDRPSRGGR